jgi:hypothetical protein
LEVEVNTASVSVISHIRECTGGCGKLVGYDKYCHPCEKLADEYEAKESKVLGPQVLALSGMIGTAMIIFLVGMGFLAIASIWVGLG